MHHNEVFTMDFLFSFSGRVGRVHFWLMCIVFVLLSIAIEVAVDLVDGDEIEMIYVFELMALWPALAITIKRWHDRGKSGWWALTAFVPVVGQIYALIQCGFLSGAPEDNRFGPSATPAPYRGPQPVRAMGRPGLRRAPESR